MAQNYVRCLLPEESSYKCKNVHMSNVNKVTVVFCHPNKILIHYNCSICQKAPEAKDGSG
jgi:hypothetical protein